MNGVDLMGVLVANGADRQSMGRVLLSLGESGMVTNASSDLTAGEIVTAIIGATSADPTDAAAHTNRVSELIRHDGRSLADVLGKIITAGPHEIYISELMIGLEGNQATIRYHRGLSDSFSVHGGLTTFTPAVVIRGSVIRALAEKVSRQEASV